MAVELPTGMEHLTEVVTQEEELRQLVSSRINGRIRGLHIAVNGDVLVISGRASSYYSKQLATHAVLDVANSRVIQNEVIVGQAD